MESQQRRSKNLSRTMPIHIYNRNMKLYIKLIRRIIYLENMSQIQGKLLNFDKISQRQDLTFIDDENDFEIQ